MGVPWLTRRASHCLTAWTLAEQQTSCSRLHMLTLLLLRRALQPCRPACPLFHHDAAGNAVR